MALCYKDRTFCASDCTDKECYRFASARIKRDAEAFGLPMAYADFSTDCPEYRPGREED